MPSRLAVGLMSGTSADGITAALIRLDGRGLRVLKHRTWPYAPELRRRVLKAAGLPAPELSRLNVELGEAFARAARSISRGARPAVIGSHGQTVWHGPEDSPPNTLQLGEPCVIAERTGLPVVADFRPRDLAAGGQGAPLLPAFDEFLFAAGPLRAMQNIGGIANVSIVGRGRLWSAFDTGPGNGLMDLAARLATRGRRAMDEDGRLAARGRTDAAKLERLLAQPYFRKPPPKSLDIGFFGEGFLRQHLGPVTPRRLPDILATLALLTARSIAESCRRWAPGPLSELVVSGGGANNPVLMGRLSELMRPVPVARSDKYGLPVMAKEAAAFAWLALRALEGRPNNCPRATGARGPRVLGKIVPGNPPGVRIPEKVLLKMRAYPAFYQAVWRACAEIPKGEVRSYGWIARRIGKPKAARAVGQALAKNPFAPLIPCHRVVGADGRLTGFSAPGGVGAKRRLLAREAIQAERL